ncbi:MAG: hypothetical protein WC483_05375 [Candidatus Paceibacterota bacterium]|jgi:HAD superfamily hydrolase (TIGR01509 family)
MKVILADAAHTFVDIEGKIFDEMYRLLEEYPNKKIILTSANDEQYQKYGLDKMPYEVFTLKHNPEKSDPKYFEVMLKKFCLSRDDVIYFEHNLEAINGAQLAGIKTYHYDENKKDLVGLKKFLDDNL